ncbi:MAG: hypothetical protein GKR87_05580 [Kiritimatiellae bacterium]|nr:hypothetical protein [Kiritimatiellia bacterium]
MDSPSQEYAYDKIDSLELNCYQPFILLLLALDKPAQSCTWDRLKLTVEHLTNQDLPISTSSYDKVSVLKQRQACFSDYLSKLPVNRETLVNFHKNHEPKRGPSSICMHRDDAETVSFSHIIVEKDSIHFYYTPTAPCQSSTPIVQTLRSKV